MALRLLGDREHSRLELRRKLQRRGFAAEPVEGVLEALARQGLQSDQRFVEAYIAGRVEHGSGPLRLRAELRERGLDEPLIERQLAAYAEQWPELLRRVHDAKYGRQPPADRRELAKRARFLEYRGFPAELIRQLLFDPD